MKLPLKLDRHGYATVYSAHEFLTDDNGETILGFWNPDTPQLKHLERNAQREYVIRAVNSHAALMEACSAANILLAEIAINGGFRPGQDGINDWSKLQQQLRAALALAEGTTGKGG